MPRLSKKVLFIIPYFGQFPNYFEAYLKSISYNNCCDFLLVTDNKNEFDCPTNLKVVNMSFECLQNKIINLFWQKYNLTVKIDVPYKLCDYRPLYSIIFEEYLTNYEFYGYCDMDIIFGKIDNFINDDILNFCYKLNVSGAFTILKNDIGIADILVNDIGDLYHFSFREISKFGDVAFHYDEYNGIDQIFNIYDFPVYICNKIADIDFRYNGFYLLDCNFESNDISWYFKFENGIIYGINNNFNEEEFLYVHLQKRKMQFNISNYDSFYIVPNEFSNDLDLKKLKYQKQLVPYKKWDKDFYLKKYDVIKKFYENNLKEIIEESLKNNE